MPLLAAIVLVGKTSAFAGLGCGMIDMGIQLCEQLVRGISKGENEHVEPMVDLQRTYRAFAVGTVLGVAGAGGWQIYKLKVRTFQKGLAIVGIPLALWSPVYITSATTLSRRLEEDAPGVLFYSLVTTTVLVGGTITLISTGAVPKMAGLMVRDLLLTMGCELSALITFGFVNKYQQYQSHMHPKYDGGRWCGVSLSTMRVLVQAVCVVSGNILAGAIVLLPFHMHDSWFILSMLLFPAEIHSCSLNMQCVVENKCTAEDEPTAEEAANLQARKMGREILPLFGLPYGFADGHNLPKLFITSLGVLAVASLGLYISMYDYEWKECRAIYIKNSGHHHHHHRHRRHSKGPAEMPPPTAAPPSDEQHPTDVPQGV
eukprot:Sspe_Gene.26338::Locus_10862_Transcript_1_1_Confidence_1.000_Length_1318::g.26338::m.26338